jgi:hypothetical protein
VVDAGAWGGGGWDACAVMAYDPGLREGKWTAGQHHPLGLEKRESREGGVVRECCPC